MQSGCVTLEEERQSELGGKVEIESTSSRKNSLYSVAHEHLIHSLELPSRNISLSHKHPLLHPSAIKMYFASPTLAMLCSLLLSALALPQTIVHPGASPNSPTKSSPHQAHTSINSTSPQAQLKLAAHSTHTVLEPSPVRSHAITRNSGLLLHRLERRMPMWLSRDWCQHLGV